MAKNKSPEPLRGPEPSTCPVNNSIIRKRETPVNVTEESPCPKTSLVLEDCCGPSRFVKMDFMHRTYVLILAVLFAISLLPISAWSQQDDTEQNSQEQKEYDSAREAEQSSSKDTRVDLSPPADDAKRHPESGAAISDAETDASDVQEFQPWDPHKAAKDVEVGDFYYKRKNYRAARDRYKEALIYKPNDAIANFRLGECEEKTGDPKNAATYYQAYLKILPHGPLAVDAQKALERLKGTEAKGAVSK